MCLSAPIPGAGASLEQCLAHTAGLPDYGSLPAYHQAVAARGTPWDRATFLERSLAQGRVFAPGAGWSYSNIGYRLAVEAIETATGARFAELFDERVAGPLGLSSVRLARTVEDLSGLVVPANGYHPGWVAHGCLIGTVRDAALFLHGLFSGALIGPDALSRMRDRYPLGQEIAGRPWRVHGYGLGLMSGEMERAGQAEGHSGGGPFSACAVYHFAKLSPPMTVAVFGSGPDEAPYEWHAAKIASRHAARL